MLDYFTDTTVDKEFEIAQIAAKVYKTACRKDFSEYGFALIKLPSSETSNGLRKKIVDLKDALSVLHKKDRGAPLGWFNMSRFDQQATTKPHRDAAPSESLLILGYEPTPIESSLLMADYSKCAYEMGITPDAFLTEFNPMYEKGLEKLAPFITQLGKFDKTSFQILVINNSSQAYSVNNKSWCGVLHSATVIPGAALRVINSTCVFPLEKNEQEQVTPEQIAEFLNTDALAGSYSAPTRQL